MQFTGYGMCLWIILLSLSVSEASGQIKTADSSILDKEPYFARHKVKPDDALFAQDLAVLKQYAKLDSTDRELLHASILSNMLIEEVDKGKPVSYRTVIDYLHAYKQTEAYKQFAASVKLYRQLEGTKVNPAHWEEDKILFVQLGFTENDLADFKEYMMTADHKDLTYKQAYVSYMTYLDSLGVGR